ncbi:uncharacterized protein MONBRDRAFT_37065 [Monosiga brevicollis MX1]|uniref:TNFR-Cys domain-containing protein n=1 Tax=Monosiga brevicollis TaxID=81824 RepID=A9UZE0_MONBE|nr:uncharacterized protein MONBRDRAFT_37065 [Monosiga brevicollis MX1]EDQ89352.1 predicted protein [Monosiga brevicollis MX1]|eukprot:XP_001745928.1 hypothetical protein [Monosiga brevicollis MX1]
MAGGSRRVLGLRLTLALVLGALVPRAPGEEAVVVTDALGNLYINSSQEHGGQVFVNGVNVDELHALVNAMSQVVTTQARLIDALTPCADGTFLAQGETVSSARLCSPCTQACPENQWLASPCTGLRNARCEPCTACDPNSEYEAHACTTHSDTVCLSCTDCLEDQALEPCSARADTICRPRNWGFSLDLEAPLAWSSGNSVYHSLHGFEPAASGQRHATFIRAETSFNGSTATTAASLGYYLIAFNIRLENLTNGWFQVGVHVNNGISFSSNGLSVAHGSAEIAARTFTSIGIVRLAPNTPFYVGVYAINDPEFVVGLGSGLAAYRVQPTEGFYAMLTEENFINVTGEAYPITGWSAASPNSATTFVFGGELQDSVYTAKESGVFLVTLSMMFDNRLRASDDQDADPWAADFDRLLVIVNEHATHKTPLQAIRSWPYPHEFESVTFSALVFLQAGDQMRAGGYSHSTRSFSFLPHSHFSAARLEPSLAFCALKLSTSASSTSEAFEVTGWSDLTDSSGLCFDRGGAFNGTSGRFFALKAGFYYATATIRLDNLMNASHATVSIRSSADSNASSHEASGLSAVRTPFGGLNLRVESVSVAGLLYLDEGDYASVWVHVQGTQLAFEVNQESSFSMALID